MRSLQRTTRPGADAPSTRPWPVIVPTLLCAALVIVGSLGPWVLWERHSRTAPQAWTEHGYTSSGVFTLVFAVIAMIALVVAIRGHDHAFLAWLTVAMLALAALTGTYEWMLIADAITAENTEYRAEWGMILVALAGLAGTGFAILAARAINDH